ncbi:MAG TPA: hypothetical protein VGS03_09605 [Candidatus Polarisedimenticolia bacterium]|nr:hypothetical protein [Candidatus Polarisedimenticolia bacterium]
MRRHLSVRPLVALALAVAAALALPPATGIRSAAAAQSGRTDKAPARTTRADLDAVRRRAAVLESELALAATRKPYLVLDLGGRALRYRLMGMTMREVPIPDLAVEGLETSEGTPGTPLLAGIFTLQEKENDPRLKPLSPEQVEDGADDENAANALPPEPPREYRLSFKQPIAIEVLGRETRGGVDGMWGRFVGALRRWHGPGGGDEARLKIALHLDPDVAAEVYRSLIPELRLLVLPPGGMTLPAAGQESPPKPRPAKKIPPPVEKPAEPKEVPFAIPPPEDEQSRKAAEENAEPPPAEAPQPAPAPAPEPPPPPPPGGGKQASGGGRGGTSGSHGSGGAHGLSGRLSRPT